MQPRLDILKKLSGGRVFVDMREFRINNFRTSQLKTHRISKSLTNNPVGFVSFPDGYIGNPGSQDRNYALELGAVYTGLERHRFRLGGGYKYQDTNTNESKNFGPGVIDGTESPIDGTWRSRAPWFSAD